MTFRASLMIGLAAALFCGCFTSTAIRPMDVSLLDGYQASDPNQSRRHLETLDGGRVTFRPSSMLALDINDEHTGGRFTSISVHDGLFQGSTTDGRTIQAPVSLIRSADVREHHVAGTVAIVAGAVLVSLLGIAVFAMSQQQTAVEGRALRVRGRTLLAPPVGAETGSAATEGWRSGARAPSLSALSSSSRAALATFWTEAGRAEHASVPAFSRLSLTLIALGAPSRLVAAAHRAALEEIEHARLSFALASAYAGQTVVPGPLAELGAASAVTATSLTALATESLIDGCYLEGIAAAVAAEALARAEDAAVRDALAAIVPDERAHAELAWDVVVWCCAEGGPAVRQHVAKLASALPRTRAPREAPPELAAHGCLGAAAWRAVADRTRLDVEARALSVATA